MSTILDRRLSRDHRSLLRRMPAAAARSGVGVHLVGGAVRDILLGITPAELDMAASGGGEDPVGALAQALGGAVISRSQFGTARLEAAGVEFDVARTRRETYARPGALPTVTFTRSIDDDLPRRDFAMNAMAVSLNRDDFGDLLDPLGGQGALEARHVRVLHPRSFEDDPTRILRAVRYAGRLGFEIEGETAQLLAKDLRWLDSVSGDRVRREMEHASAEGHVAEILELADHLGVLGAVHPALSLPEGLADRLREEVRPSPLGLLAALAVAAGDAARDGMALRLGLTPGPVRAVRDIGKLESRLERLSEHSLKASETCRLLRDVDDRAVEGWALAHRDARVRRRLDDYLRRLRGVATLLDGRDVMALGVEEGPAVGEMLRALLMARLDGEVSSREEEERFVRRRLEELP